MLITIDTHHLKHDDTLEAHARKRLAYALSHAHDKVHSVQVTLQDINGPRGGIDKSCKLVIDIKGLDPIIIEDIQADIISAIDRAADRAGRAIARKIEKSRHFTSMSINH